MILFETVSAHSSESKPEIDLEIESVGFNDTENPHDEHNPIIRRIYELLIRFAFVLQPMLIRTHKQHINICPGIPNKLRK